MPQIIRPAAKVKIVPKEGEIEITLNINITVDGQIVATGENAKSVRVEEENKEEKSPFIIPDFSSGLKLNFGKKEGSP
jgi:hypothetical protein